MKTLLLTLCVAAVTSSAFATSIMPPEPKDQTLASLAKLEKAWKAQKIMNYSYQLSESCFCAPRSRTLSVKVTAGVGKIVKNTTTKWQRDTISSVDKLYAQMRTMLKQGGRVAVVMGKYNVPSQVVFDPNPKATDDELYVSVDKFTKK